MSWRSPIAAALAVAAVVAVVGVGVLISQRGGSHPSASPGASPSSGRSDRPSAASSTSPMMGRLLPATSRRPSVGVCGRTTGALLVVKIEPDTPNPRCVSVNAAQRLRVVNRTGDYGAHPHAVTVVWVPGRPLTLRPGEAKTFPRPFGTYLAQGVHELKAGRGYRSEVWLH